MSPHTPHDQEHEPLLDSADDASPRSPSRSRWWKTASPIWCVLVIAFPSPSSTAIRIAPVVLVSSLCRGMTLAPRIEVYTAIACRALHDAPTATLVSGHNAFYAPSLLPSNHSEQSANVVLPDIPASVMDECSADPKVQARAARIQASVKTTESVLSAVTTGWLSHLGDLYGRKKILGLSIFGALFMDFIYILVSSQNSFFGKHGEAFIITAPLIEGFLGAQSTYNGITHAYATDCTPDGSRSKIFSTMQGMLYVGLAAGPWINGAVLNFVPNSDTNSLFALAIAIAVTNLVFVVFILPESLPPSRRLAQSSSSHAEDKPITRAVKTVVDQIVRPIAVFVPPKLDGGRKGRDWNLTLTGITLFIYILSIQVYNLKYLYVKHVYDWNGEQLGYYMSLLFVTRAIFLLLILPGTSFHAPCPSPLTSTPAVLTYFAPDRHRRTLNSTPTALASAIRFDRRIVSISFFTDASANALVVLSPTSSQALFVLLTSLNSLTSGGNPALHSLGAVSLQAMGKGGELGLVFGALGVVNAVAHIIAPGIYAAIYGATVANFPKMIFLMSALLLYSAVVMLLGIRPNINLRPEEPEAASSVYQDLPPSPEEATAGTEAPEGNQRKRGRRHDRDPSEDARRASVMRISVSEETL
ncbi:MFS general substrate transporter [Auriscalpium vulgare]|uniref:MFS general substrate transporter n=1 Tax=Auriscalpium vulgare TaxID=40419 RepID=A0ACB8RWT5_9AGAM|nr:MFS general substrate transporter [Auriscalpium vulgare]